MMKTRIVATIGPASSNREVIEGFVDSGVTIARLNMSHGSHADHQKSLEIVRDVAREKKAHVASLVDLCGPKVRTREMDPENSEIKPGDRLRIVRENELGNAGQLGTNYPGLVDEVQIGHRVLIDDGTIRLMVVEKNDDALVCQCRVGGTIGSRKGINVPDSDLSLPSLSEKDRADLQWAIRNGVDFVALSFVRHPDDVHLLRIAIDKTGSELPIVAKIETPQAISKLDEIISASDVILVARGDLGVEMDVSRIPMLQKDMIVRCRKQGKPVIVATQMLQSMVDLPTPTRAEVSDVANAVLDGTDAVMLSAESAAGKFPLESVQMMAQIIDHAHEYQSELPERRAGVLTGRLRVGQEQDRTSSAVARSAVIVAQDLNASLIAMWARSGKTARWVSKYQPARPVVVISQDPAVCRRSMISYGLRAMLVPPEYAELGMSWSELQRRLVERLELNRGDTVVMVGDPAAPARVPTLSIYVIGSEEQP
ncbi:MAG: pyruvate kinase [Planctomycetota bacterium]